MKEEKFKVIQYIRELIINIDKNLDNFPKKDIELKNRIRTNSYDLLELVYEANSTREKERKLEILDKTIAKLKVIDFLINMCFDKQIINNKRYLDSLQKISNDTQKKVYAIFDDGALIYNRINKELEIFGNVKEFQPDK